MTSSDLRDTLRQMLAVLEEERQALAGLDLDAIVGATNNKNHLCGTLDSVDPATLDEECLGLVDAARRLNEVNRQVRNIVAANVSRRLDALTGGPQLYRASAGYTRAATLA
ncbi:flagellar protein FlgN [Novosphingobium mangrovi (ex Huang et al. 2023)]|uniref:Flagellar protein FlgN n=1 Tax=Novosphingobium mangrovi (ex Huang et al. 2023) TaxID=2976432 RepID=A0ABT2I019_9SPHN|nr:flagellar protein FlgN [Novosphingobium mangrovi (ex Huang et al. 2023)]MCT2398146.1 flagellar protein FlgN [Novosphingobium mangrovi (ex Huang et al. 2023)]